MFVILPVNCLLAPCCSEEQDILFAGILLPAVPHVASTMSDFPTGTRHNQSIPIMESYVVIHSFNWLGVLLALGMSLDIGCQ